MAEYNNYSSMNTEQVNRHSSNGANGGLCLYYLRISSGLVCTRSYLPRLTSYLLSGDALISPDLPWTCHDLHRTFLLCLDLFSAGWTGRLVAATASYLSRSTMSWAGRGLTCPNLPWTCLKRTQTFRDVSGPAQSCADLPCTCLKLPRTYLPRVVTCTGLPVTYPEVPRLAFDLARACRDLSGPAKTCIVPAWTCLEVAWTWLGPTWPSQDMLCAAQTYPHMPGAASDLSGPAWS